VIPSIGPTQNLKVARRTCAHRISAGQRRDGENALKLPAKPAQIGSLPTEESISLHGGWLGMRAMVEATRVPASAERGPPPSVPNALGLTQTKRFGCSHVSILIMKQTWPESLLMSKLLL